MVIIAFSFFYDVVRIKLGIDLRFSIVYGYWDLCESVTDLNYNAIKCENIILLNREKGAGYGIDFRQFDSSDGLGLGYLIDSGIFVDLEQKVFIFPFVKSGSKIGCSLFFNLLLG